MCAALLEIAQQPGKGGLKRVMVLPVAEVGDEILAHLNRQVVTRLGIKALPRLKHRKIDQAYGKEFPAAGCAFGFACPD